MEKTVSMYVLLVVFMFAILPLVFTQVKVSAHTHDEVINYTEIESNEIARMEKLLSLLNQLVRLMNTLKVQQSYSQTIVEPAHMNASSEMNIHHTEHQSVSSDAQSATSTAEVIHVEPKLVIELETHANGTHAHVRYVDKPEVMFFVSANIHDEAGIVAGIVAKTGLSAEEVQTALKYMH